MLTTSSPLKIAALLVISGSLQLQAHTGTIEGQFHANIGGKVVLPCNTTLRSSVDWRYHYSPFESPSFVFSNRRMYVTVPKRIYVNFTKVGKTAFYDMTITNASSTDSGLYTCVEDGGLGHRHTYSLLVDEASETEAPSIPTGTQSNAPLVVLIIIVIILLVIVVIILTVLLVCGLHYCHRVRKQQTDEPGKDANESGMPMLSVVNNMADDESNFSYNTKEISKPLPLPTSIKFTASAVGADETKGKQVRGVCVHDNYLYVIRTPDPEKHIYDRLTTHAEQTNV